MKKHTTWIFEILISFWCFRDQYSLHDLTASQGLPRDLYPIHNALIFRSFTNIITITTRKYDLFTHRDRLHNLPLAIITIRKMAFQKTSAMLFSINGFSYSLLLKKNNILTLIFRIQGHSFLLRTQLFYNYGFVS